MIVQVLTDAGEIGVYDYTEVAQLCRGADTGQQEYLRRSDRASAQDDFAFRTDDVRVAVFRVLSSAASRTVHHQLPNVCVRHDREIGPRQRGSQVGVGRTLPFVVDDILSCHDTPSAAVPLASSVSGCPASMAPW